MEQTMQPHEKTMHPNSYWAATAGEEVAGAALVGAHDADVAVVGGGFTGLRTALLLAESGAQVTVVEAARIGWGASGRNGGQVNPLLPANTPQDIARMYGKKRQPHAPPAIKPPPASATTIPAPGPPFPQIPPAFSRAAPRR